MSEVIDKKWYVVRAISGQENKIKTFIDNEVKRLISVGGKARRMWSFSF